MYWDTVKNFKTCIRKHIPEMSRRKCIKWGKMYVIKEECMAIYGRWGESVDRAYKSLPTTVPCESIQPP